MINELKDDKNILQWGKDESSLVSKNIKRREKIFYL